MDFDHRTIESQLIPTTPPKKKKSNQINDLLQERLVAIMDNLKFIFSN